MKKTYNINISGYGFVIDEDAYDILDNYLSTLGQICGRAGQTETARDIEQRIAEIFSEKAAAAGGAQIITRTVVEEVIGRMGSPEIIVEESEAPATPPPLNNEPPKVAKRLYRDVNNKVLGGVCSGLGWYLGIDPVWVRIVMVALAFLSGSTMALIYIVLWIVIPPAKSPYERMQMMGMGPSTRNVGNVVTGNYTDSPGAGAGTDTSNVGSVVIMILTVLGLLISGALLVALSLAFIGCLIAICVTPGGSHYTGVAEAKLVMGCVMGGSLVAGIPLFLLFRFLIGVLTKKRFNAFTAPQRVFMLVPWLLGVAACIVCGILLGHL